MNFDCDPLKELNVRDRRWLRKLAGGYLISEIHPQSAYAKQRLSKIRDFFGARTTTQAVVEAIRCGIIPVPPQSQCNTNYGRDTIGAVGHGSNHRSI
jgi:hypothetical protein